MGLRTIAFIVRDDRKDVLQIQSKPGRGTTMFLHFRRLTNEEENRIPKNRQEPVLIIDDHAMVR
jgi:hypothetical protein